jgi:hypothetical protein
LGSWRGGAQKEEADGEDGKQMAHGDGQAAGAGAGTWAAAGAAGGSAEPEAD